MTKNKPETAHKNVKRDYKKIQEKNLEKKDSYFINEKENR
jgi:hypothetical protein